MPAQKVSESSFDFTKSRSQMLIIESVRLGFLVAILLITLVWQAFQPGFVNLEVLLPIYGMMAFSFCLNTVFLLFLPIALRNWVAPAVLFAFESVFVTALIYFTGVAQSIFLFLYLVNIILCGFVFGRKGSLVLSLWTSILFSALLIFGPEIRGQTLFFAVGLNNLAFFAVAILSGYLSEQLNFMGSELLARRKDLSELKSLNELILDNIATGLITMDDEGVLLQANRAAVELLDLSADGLIGKNLDEILPGLWEKVADLQFLKPGNDLDFEARLNDSLQAAKEDHPLNLAFYQNLPKKIPDARSLRFDHKVSISEQDKRVFEMIISPLQTGDGERKGFVLTFQDLTKIRRLEFAMRQSEKMAAVGQLAAGIAHEIRNPLASISGSIQLLASTLASSQEEEKRLMAIVMREIDRLNNLITEFLDFVRPDAPKEDPVDLQILTRDVLEMIKFNKNLRLDVQQQVTVHGRTLINGNRDKLKQALLNVVINAYQAMIEAPVPILKVDLFERDGKVVLKIKDSGVGIDEKSLRKIFEPFHTTKPKGSGLGLAVTHKIIENHSGKIFVESQKNIGTEFTLEFPLRLETGSLNFGLADSSRELEDLKKKKWGNG